MRTRVLILAILAWPLASAGWLIAQSGKPPAAVGPSTAPASAPAPPPEAEPPAPATSPAVPKAPRPTKRVPYPQCVTAECHASVKQYDVLHGPVNVNACNACHTLTSAEKHTFVLARGKTETCTFCHKQKTAGAPFIHKPVRGGECLPCHNPHGAANKRFLRGSSMKELCRKCHKKVYEDKRHVHGPVAAGACGSCHQAHVAMLPYRLVAQGRDLCLGCHAEMKKQMLQAKYTHKAVQAECVQCHDAHASDYPMQTKQPPVTLCMEKCHKEVRDAVTGAPHKHSVVLKDLACLHCHTAHGGDLAKLMRTLPVKACMKCHDKKIDVPNGEPIAAVPEVLDPKLIKHGPIRTGNCGGCHAVHGAQVDHLLTKPYPDTFYEPFEVDKYALCFDCHNKALALLPASRAVTGFRNGEQNLHYVHINKARQGRSCRACHSTHASGNPMHVQEAVPYGNWKLPINFTSTQTGGKCASGCHRELAYDRNDPIDLKTNVARARAEAGTPAGKSPATPTTAPSTRPATSADTGVWLKDLLKPTTAPARVKAFESPLPEADWMRSPTGPTTGPAPKKAKE